MHKFILNMFLLFLSTGCWAQDLTTTSYQQLAQKEATAMKNGMNLSATQTDSLLHDLTNFYQSLLLLSQNLTITRRKQAIDSLNLVKQAHLKKILTNSQWNQYLQDMEMKKANMQKAIEDRRGQKLQAQQKAQQQ